MATASVGQIGLDLVVNQNGFNKQMQGITGLAKKAGAALAAAFAVKKLVDFGEQCIELGSDLNEVQNVVDVTFSTMSSKVNEFARNAAASFGLSETMAKKFTGTFGAMAKAFGFSESAAYDMSTTLTGLAGDVASFYNISQDEAYTKLKSVFTGETETLKDLGVVMTQAALDQYALANGYGKTTAKMSEAEKVALRYAFVTKQLSLASGDFIRTSGGWANQVRVLKLQFDSFKATIGQGLINLFTPIIQTLNTLIGKLQGAADAFKAFTELIAGKSSSNTSGSVASVANDAQAATDSILGMGNAAETSAKKAKGALAGFDELNNISSSSSAGTSTASSGTDTETAIPTVATEETNNQINGIAVSLEKVKKLCDEIGTSFKTGFLDKIKLVDTSQLTGALATLKDTLSEILNDSGVTEAAKGFVTSYAETIGSNIGTFVVVGENIVTNLVSGVSDALAKNKDFIKDRLTSIFDSGIKFNTITQNVNDLIADISEVWTSDTAVGITSDIVSIFSNGFLGVADLAGKIGTDMLDLITAPFINNKDKIKTAIEGTLAPIKTVTESISTFVTNTVNKALEVYDTYMAPAFERLKTVFTDVFGAALDAYNTYLAPVLQYIADRFSVLVSDYIQPVIDAFLNFAGKLVECGSVILEALSPFLQWFVSTFIKNISSVLKDLWNVFESVFKLIADAVKNILNIFSGLLDFITGVFSGDWDKAWGGIKDIFSGIWKLITDLVSDALGVVKAVVESVLSAIKRNFSTLISGVKGLFSGIGDWFKSTFSAAWNGIKSGFSGVKTWFKDRYDDITGVFKKIPDWFKTKFTEAWTNVKNVFSTGGKIFDGIKDGIAGVFKTVVNGIISGINKIIKVPFDSINSMLNTIRNTNILGIKPFSGLWSENPLSVPQIPALAQGGYVKANTPQLAMIGDNKTQGEIVAPEGKLLELLKTAVASSGGITKEELYSVLVSIINTFGLADKMQIAADSKGVFKLIRVEAANYKNTTGKDPFL